MRLIQEANVDDIVNKCLSKIQTGIMDLEDAIYSFKSKKPVRSQITAIEQAIQDLKQIQDRLLKL